MKYVSSFASPQKETSPNNLCLIFISETDSISSSVVKLLLLEEKHFLLLYLNVLFTAE